MQICVVQVLFFFFCAIDLFLVQVYSLQLVVEMRSGEVRSLRQQLAVANQQVTFFNKIAPFDFFQPTGYFFSTIRLLAIPLDILNTIYIS